MLCSEMENVSATESVTSSLIDGTNSTVDPYFLEFSPYYKVLNVVYYVLLGPIAVVGNIVSVAVARRILRYRPSIPDMLTGWLAACDLLCVLSAHTPAVISIAEGQWTGGAAVCSFQYFMAWSCLKTSFFIIILMTIDRFLALVKPFYYRAKVTLRQMKIAALSLTVFSFTSTSVTIIWFSDEITLLPNWYLCMNTWGKDNQYYSYILTFYGLTFIVGVIVFNVCNTGIVCSLIRHSRKNEQMRLRVLSAARERRERRVAKIIETLSVIFMLFWMPYLVFIILHQTNVLYSEFAEDLSIRILFANTLLNPVIYGVFNRTYRKACRYFLHKLLYLVLCGRISKPKERRIFYLRQSFLQHRLARKTHSHGPDSQPMGNGTVTQENDEPLERQRSATNGTLILANGTLISGNLGLGDRDSIGNHSLTETRDLALDNFGFTPNFQDTLEKDSESGIFTLDGCEKAHKCTNINEKRNNLNGHLQTVSHAHRALHMDEDAAKNTKCLGESTWL